MIWKVKVLFILESIFGSDQSSTDDGVAVDDISITGLGPVSTYAWSTDATNGTAGWSATNTEDITVTNEATINHVGNYTLTVTDGNGCNEIDIVRVLNNDPVIGAQPVIGIDTTLTAFNSCTGHVSDEQSLSVLAYNLTNNINVTAPSGYEVSNTSGQVFQVILI